jgi:hypothetical protein
MQATGFFYLGFALDDENRTTSANPAGIVAGPHFEFEKVNRFK